MPVKYEDSVGEKNEWLPRSITSLGKKLFEATVK
jgi:hypothetical protein